MEKRCNKCKTVKPLVEFSKDNKSKDGYQSKCKSCNKKYHEDNRLTILEKKRNRYQQNKDKILSSQKKYYQENKDKISDRNKKYRESNKEKIKERKRKYYQNNKEKITKRNKKWNEDNREKVLQYSKERYYTNKDIILENQKKYKESNKEKIKETKRKYYHNNKEKINSYKREWSKKRRDKNDVYKYHRNISSLIRISYKRKSLSKKTKTANILGCSSNWFFNDWLEGMYQPPKTHLDHIVPVSLANNEAEVIALNHYSNFQLLDAFDNMSKGNDYVSLNGLSKVLTNHPNPTLVKKIISRSKIEIK